MKERDREVRDRRTDVKYLLKRVKQTRVSTSDLFTLPCALACMGRKSFSVKRTPSVQPLDRFVKYMHLYEGLHLHERFT